jgi:hypothetical protein
MVNFYNTNIYSLSNCSPNLIFNCRTPFHFDVFGSYSWSANICGRKQWFLLPPGEEVLLKDELGKLPFQITRDLLETKKAKFFEIFQETGETIFVPSRWHHQVMNVEDTVSINHNWFNGCNIDVIARNLLKHLTDVENEIQDCRDMENYEDHCQLMLKCWFGMNLEGFLDILEHIVDKRLSIFSLCNDFEQGRQHKKFDIIKVREVLEFMDDNGLNNQKIYQLLNTIEQGFESI